MTPSRNGALGEAALISSGALTLEEASAELGLAIRKSAACSPNQSPPAGAPISILLKPEEIVALRRFYNGTVLTLKTIRAKARAQKELPPEYPPHIEEVQALIERLQGAAKG